MADLNGDHLLNTFKDLNVQLLNLSPNVIKGWFDTDDKNMKYLLKWMCTSLSAANCVSPLETAEYVFIFLVWTNICYFFCRYNELQTPVSLQNIEQEVEDLESEYSELFEADLTEVDINILEDEIEMLLEEERNLDHLVSMSE